MLINVWTFLFQVVNFLVLVAILRRLLYRPLREAIDRRHAANEQARADADAARRDAEALRRTLDEQVADLEHRREAAIREARERAEVERQSILADAEGTVRRRREDVEQQFARERAEAVNKLRDELVRSAVEMAGRLLREAADSDLQRQLVQRLAAELRGIPEEERHRLRAEWEEGEAAVVETAAQLDADSLHELGAAVESLAGRSPGLSVQVRPDLIGGVRLRIGGHVWDGSLAGPMGDLESAATVGAAAEAVRA